MTTLEQEISALKTKIEGYEQEYANAAPGSEEKKGLLAVITARGNNLHDLYQQQQGILNSPRYPDSVFVLCDADNLNPVGTCFAISPQYLISCQHFMNGRILKYLIASVVVKRDGVISFARDHAKVKVVRYNTAMDYAVLQLQDANLSLTPIPISLEPVAPDIDLKLFHCPVAAFLDNSNADVGVLTKWTKSGYKTNHHLVCDGGAFRGSSGAPYVLRNGFAVGIHVESINEAETLSGANVRALTSFDDQIEMISDTVNSNASNYAAMSSVLLFSCCPKLIEYLHSIGVIP
jgi:hypothetical protein